MGFHCRAGPDVANGRSRGSADRYLISGSLMVSLRISRRFCPGRA